MPTCCENMPSSSPPTPAIKHMMAKAQSTAIAISERVFRDQVARLPNTATCAIVDAVVFAHRSNQHNVGVCLRTLERVVGQLSIRHTDEHYELDKLSSIVMDNLGQRTATVARGLPGQHCLDWNDAIAHLNRHFVGQSYVDWVSHILKELERHCTKLGVINTYGNTMLLLTMCVSHSKNK